MNTFSPSYTSQFNLMKKIRYWCECYSIHYQDTSVTFVQTLKIPHCTHSQALIIRLYPAKLLGSLGTSAPVAPEVPQLSQAHELAQVPNVPQVSQVPKVGHLGPL